MDIAISLSNQSLRKMAHKLSKLCLLLYLSVSLYVSLQQRQPKVEILTHLMIVVLDESHSGIYLFATCSPHLLTKNIISNFHEYLTDHISHNRLFVKRICFIKIWRIFKKKILNIGDDQPSALIYKRGLTLANSDFI